MVPMPFYSEVQLFRLVVSLTRPSCMINSRNSCFILLYFSFFKSHIALERVLALNVSECVLLRATTSFKDYLVYIYN